MALPPLLGERLRHARAWIALGVLTPLGMLAVSGLMLLDLRQDAWDKAEVTSKNLLQVIERDIARNVEILDLSLQGAVENLRLPDIEDLKPELRRLVLFDRSATARDIGDVLVIDEHGNALVDAGSLSPRQGNYADRDYFRVHEARDGLGLHVGRPLVSRLTGERMLPFSRRVTKPDGSFGGVALITLKLSYLTRLFDQIGLGRDGTINLYLRDGTRIMRQPFTESDIGAVVDDPTFRRFLDAPSGAFVAGSASGDIERHHAFTSVGDLPLVLDVALATRDIEAGWRTRASTLGAVVLALCGVTVFLSLLFGRELRRRDAMQAELARLSWTDALTGLANRRRYEEAFQAVWADALRRGGPLSLLVVDADHFKRFNDRHGHAVGDTVLRELARCLSASVGAPTGLAARIGGEEFALLLPGTDTDGALQVARKVHAEVSTLDVPSASIRPGTVTVSIGVATGHASAGGNPEALYRAADAALYEAKAGGRHQTRCAQAPFGPGGPGARLIQALRA
jgi:diguanylate cyclase (GGDEF)-like protein